MCGFTTFNDPYVYRTLGDYVYYTSDGSKIGVSAYITKNLNMNRSYKYRYVYTLIGVSKSEHIGVRTETWLYNTRVFLNGQQVSVNQYPNGFTLYVRTTPSIVFYWYTNDEDIGEYYFSWGSSAYEPRI